MPRILAALLVLLAASPVPLFAEVASFKNLEPGKAYLVEVAEDGTVTVTPTTVRDMKSGTPPGTGPTDPNPPAGSPFQQEITRQTKTVIVNQGGSKTTGAALATVYSLVGDKVADGSIPTDQAFGAIKAATNLVLNNADDGPAWDTWRAAVSASLTKLQQEGSLTTKAQISATFREIAAGMNAASGFKPAMLVGPEQAPGKGILGGIDIDKLIKIIELVMQLLKLFGVGG